MRYRARACRTLGRSPRRMVHPHRVRRHTRHGTRDTETPGAHPLMSEPSSRLERRTLLPKKCVREERPGRARPSIRLSVLRHRLFERSQRPSRSRVAGDGLHAPDRCGPSSSLWPRNVSIRSPDRDELRRRSRRSPYRALRPGQKQERPLCRSGFQPDSIVGVVEHSEECVLRNRNAPYLLHTFLPLFLLFEEFSFSGDVAAVTLGRDVLAQRGNIFAGNHPTADRGLDRYFELMTVDLALELLYQLAPAPIRMGTMDDGGKRVDSLARDQNIEPAQITGPIPDNVVIHRTVAARGALELVVEVVDHVRKRQFISQNRA